MTDSRETRIERITRSLWSLQQRHGLLLVAIDGPGGAGKSTLANQLCGALDATIVAVDDFYRVMNESDRYNLTPEEGYMRYGDWQRLRDQVLSPLRRSEIARYERYDWLAGKLGDVADVQPKGAVIVEGVASFRPELRNFYDYSIYVDVPHVICRARLIQRGHNSEEWIDRWAAAENWYAEHHNPLAAVDIVISGQAD